MYTDFNYNSKNTNNVKITFFFYKKNVMNVVERTRIFYPQLNKIPLYGK